MDDTVHHVLAKALAETERLRADRETYNAWATETKIGIDAIKTENERLRSALRDLLDAYLADVNPNDRNQAAIEHARQSI